MSIIFVYTQLNVKRVLLQSIQFSVSSFSFIFQTNHFCIRKEFHSKQVSFAWVRNLNVKTFQCQAIQFSMSMQFSAFWPIDRYPIKVLTLRARVELGVMAMKGYSAFPKTLALLEPHHQIVQCHTQDTCWWCLTPLQRCNLLIQLLQPTGQATEFVSVINHYHINGLRLFWDTLYIKYS